MELDIIVEGVDDEDLRYLKITNTKGEHTMLGLKLEKKDYPSLLRQRK